MVSRSRPYRLVPSPKPRAIGSVTSVLMYRVAGLAKCVCSNSQDPGPGTLNSICIERSPTRTFSRLYDQQVLAENHACQEELCGGTFSQIWPRTTNRDE